MEGNIFIGTLGYMRWAPCPRQGMTTSQSGYSEMTKLEGGGTVGVRASQYSMSYNVAFTGPTSEVVGIDHYTNLRSGVYGSGLIYFNNPYDFGTNLLAAGWASPGISEQGWYKIGDPSVSSVTYTSTAGTLERNQPQKTAVYTLIGAANAVPSAKYRHVVVIPETHRLLLGWSGSATGAGVVAYRPITRADGVAYGAAAAITPLSNMGNDRTNVSISGATYKAVEIYLTRTSSATSTLSISSMIAQLQPLNEALSHVTGSHRRGNGHTGCMFGDDNPVENYIYMHPPRKGISTVLEEVGAWQLS